MEIGYKDIYYLTYQLNKWVPFNIQETFCYWQ